MSPTSTSRIALVTGTSSGIGLASAVAAASAGWTVVATVRNVDRADDLRAAADAAGVALDIRALDITDAAAVDRIVSDVMRDHGRLDALVNNAGAAFLGTIENSTMADVRASMEVNYFGVVELTKAALPHLRESQGRVITISSVGGIVGQPFNEAYCAAKFAVEGFFESLQPVAQSVGVTVTVIEPGAVASKFVANAGLDQEKLLAASGPYRPALAGYFQRTSQQFDSGSAQISEDVGALVAETLDAEAPAFRIQTSDNARAFVSAKLADLDGSKVTAMTGAWVSA